VSLLIYLFATFSIHPKTLFTAAPPVRFGNPGAEQAGEPLGKLAIDPKRQDGKPPAVYDQRPVADETFWTVSLTLCPSDTLCVEAVVVAVESSIELPTARIARCGATDGFQKPASNIEHIMLLYVRDI
jgi:hypothetical protein